jgi:AmpD protein
LSPPLEHRTRKSTTVIDTVVCHATVEPTLAGSISVLRERGNSYHYLIDRDGTTIQCVSPVQAAFHAGKSRGPQGEGVNEYSIGISFVNENVPDKPIAQIQLDTAIELIKKLRLKFTGLKFITTHAAISPGRKDDPINFPVRELAEATDLHVWL